MCWNSVEEERQGRRRKKTGVKERTDGRMRSDDVLFLDKVSRSRNGQQKGVSYSPEMRNPISGRRIGQSSSFPPYPNTLIVHTPLVYTYLLESTESLFAPTNRFSVDVSVSLWPHQILSLVTTDAPIVYMSHSGVIPYTDPTAPFQSTTMCILGLHFNYQKQKKKERKKQDVTTVHFKVWPDSGEHRSKRKRHGPTGFSSPF